MKPRLIAFQEAIVKQSGGAISTLPEISDGILEAYIKVTLDSNIRTLYDFLDSNDLRISIDSQIGGFENREEDRFWWAEVNNIDVEQKIASGTRAEAELAGFKEALKQLEEK